MPTASPCQPGYRSEMTSAWPEEHRGDPSDDALLADESERRDDDAQVAERVQVERAATALPDLLSGSVGRRVEVLSTDGTMHRGVVGQVGDGWFLVDDGGRSHLIPLGQVVTVAGVSGPVPRSMAAAGMGWSLRRWSEMWSVVTVYLSDGSSRTGHVGDVFADAFVLVSVDGFEGRLTVPMTAVLWMAGDLLSDER